MLSWRIRSFSKRQSEQGGFTLIELIVVCTLIGIMLTLGVPSLRNSLFTDPLKSSARKVIGFVGGVRELAVRHQQAYVLHISQAENRIWYEEDRDQATEIEDVPVKELQLPDGVRITETELSESGTSILEASTIWISKEGYLAPTVLRLENEEGNRLSVQFYPFLDSATVSDDESAI